MDTFNAKRISDPVHGTIGLSKTELELIGCPAFQRLRGVKQLGLANLVFPGADYSRFSHSLGVCHIAGRILDALARNGHVSGTDLDENEIQKYRLAALLHDVGHYPFSHAMEDALKDKYAGQKLEGPVGSSNSAAEDYFSHERVGKEILAADPQITEVLKRKGFDPAEIASVILRERPPRFANLISSDMDADRIDYLLRTAHHTGLPYGSVDLEYLLTQVRVDSENRICLTSKALRAAEHFLLCRYFDYQQVAYHKTVAGFEWLLKDSLQALIIRSVIKCGASDVKNMLANGDWRSFDDSKIMGLMRDALDNPNFKPSEKLKISAILDRRPPCVVATYRCLPRRDDVSTHRNIKQLLSIKLDNCASTFDIPRENLHVWTQDGMALTKIGSRIPISQLASAMDDQKDLHQQAIRILAEDGTRSLPIVELKQSLMGVLSDYALYEIRVYAVLPEHNKLSPEETRKWRDKIRQHLFQSLNNNDNWI